MGDLSVSVEGSGPTLLWGHGLLSSRDAEDASGPVRWTEVERPGLRLVRWDARGHGRSPQAVTPAEVHWPRLAGDALALADELDAGTFAIGGASMGAATALWVAATAPERVERLILAIPPTAWATRSRSAGLYRVVGAISGAVPSAAARSRAVVLRGAAESDLPARAVLATITVPTLILAWRHDPIHPASTAEALAELIPHAELVVTSRPADTTGWAARIAAFLGRWSKAPAGQDS